MSVAEGVPLNFNLVKRFISNKNSLYTEVLFDEVEPAAPEEYSIDLALDTPIKLPLAEPLVEILSSYISTFLNAVDSPLIKVTSGVP